ncbi:hypothetical protein ACH4NF_01905 [Streptomyces sp. NPDC017248]|uniref:hypothetical protein n=1 Tax=unclassified Streptomyces TaxID=2593676 RepID=UPI0037A81AB5
MTPGGVLALDDQAFDARETPGQQLVIHHAEPGSGSGSAHTLRLLGSVHAARTRSAPHNPDRG